MLPVLLDEVDVASLFLFHRPEALTRLMKRNYEEVVEQLASECRDRNKAEEAVAKSLYKLLRRVGPLAKAGAIRQNKFEEAVVTLFDLFGRVGFDPSIIADEESRKRLNVASQFRSWLVSESRFRLRDRDQVLPPPLPQRDHEEYAERVKRAVDIHYQCFHQKFWDTGVCDTNKARRVVALHLWGDHCRDYCPKSFVPTFRSLPPSVRPLTSDEEATFVQALQKRVNQWSPDPAISAFFFGRACPSQHALKMMAVAEALGLTNPTVTRVVKAYRDFVIRKAKKNEGVGS